MAFPLIHHLYYSWAGWPTEGAFPPAPPAAFFDALRAAWKADGLELQSRAWTPEQIQMTFRTEPQVAPMPHRASVSLGFWIGVGGRHEPAALNGISHFIEHMVFKGTSTR